MRGLSAALLTAALIVPGQCAPAPDAARQGLPRRTPEGPADRAHREPDRHRSHTAGRFGRSGGATSGVATISSNATALSDPSAAPPKAPSEVGSPLTRLALRRGVAGGPRPATDDPAGREGRSFLGRWMRTAGQVAAASGWAMGKLIRSGRWGGRADMAFDRDSSDSEVGDGTFGVVRSALRGGASLRNPELILGPRLLVGNVGLDFSLSRDALRVGGLASPGTGRVAGYDVGLTALPDRAFSIGLFAARNQNVLPTIFGTARDQRTERRGALVRLRAPILDSTINWTEESFESEARTQRSVYRDGENRRIFAYTGTGSSVRQTLALDYRRERRTDLVFPALSFPLQTTKLRYGFALDEEVSGRSLVSTIGLTRRGGDLRRDHLRAETRLDYQLSPALDTRSAFRLERVDASTIERDSRNVDFQLQHRLYESLVTTVALRGTLEEFQSGSRDLYGGRLLFDYRKKLIAGGRLSARLARTYDREANRFGEGEDVVLDEVHTARFGAPIRLQVARVIPGGVVVTDAARSTIFQEGFDYTVEFIGDFAEIGIVPEGRIQDGRTVIVDYRVRVSPFTSTLTTQPLLDLSVDYGWINPYLHLQRVSRTLLSGRDDGSVFDRTSRTAGVRLRWSLRKLRIALDGTRRTENARNLSFESLQFGQVVSYSFGPGRGLSVDLVETVTDFRIPDRRESLGSARVDFRWQATPVMSLQAVGLARRRRDSLGFDEDFYQAGVDGRWQRVNLELFTSISRNWGERAQQSFDGLRVSVGATRSF